MGRLVNWPDCKQSASALSRSVRARVPHHNGCDVVRARTDGHPCTGCPWVDIHVNGHGLAWSRTAQRTRRRGGSRNGDESCTTRHRYGKANCDLPPGYMDVPRRRRRRAASENHAFHSQQARVVARSPIPRIDMITGELGFRLPASDASERRSGSRRADCCGP